MADRPISLADAVALPLEVTPGSSHHVQDIDAAYRRLVRQHHLGAGGSADQFVQVQDAYKAAIREGSG